MFALLVARLGGGLPGVMHGEAAVLLGAVGVLRGRQAIVVATRRADGH
jgi:hypothetical protein